MTTGCQHRLRGHRGPDQGGRHDRLGALPRRRRAPSPAPSSTTARAACTASRATARTAWCTVDGEVDVRACECRASDGQKVDAPERVAVAPTATRSPSSTRIATGRCPSASTTRRWHQAEVRVADGRADDPQGGGPRRRGPGATRRATWSAPTGTPTCSSSAPAWPAWRRRSPRPRTAAACCSSTRREPGARVAPGPDDDAQSTRLRAAGRRPRAAIERLARARPPSASTRGRCWSPSAPRRRPTTCTRRRSSSPAAACEIHQVFTGNDLPGVMLARGAARLAGAHGIKPGNRAVVWAEQPEALEHVRTLPTAGVEIAAVVTARGRRRVRRRGCARSRGEVVEAHRQEARQGRGVRTAAAARRSPATCSPSARRSRPTSTCRAWPTTCPWSPPGDVLG